MKPAQKLEVQPHEDGMRLNRWVKVHFPAIRHGDLQKLLRTGQIRVDGGRVKANMRVVGGQIIRMPPEQAIDPAAKSHRAQQHLAQSDIDYVKSLVLYQDECLIAFNKPAGLAVQGGSKIFRHMDGLLQAFVTDDGDRPRLVHRLDKDTSGLLIAAKTRDSAAKLTQAFKARDTQKTYWALVSGIPRPARGSIKLPLEKKLLGGIEKIVALGLGNKNGQRALTYFNTVSTAGRTLSWVQLVPVTGRKHQLRVHLAAIGHPVIGDGKYGGEAAQPTGNISRNLHLHARSLILPHPEGGMFEIDAPLTGHIADSWKFLGLDERDALDVPKEPEG